MSKKLLTQLKNPDAIKAILREVQVSFQLSDGRDVKTLLIYLPVSEGAGAYDLFFEQIKSGILQNFVFSCSEIQKKLGLQHEEKIEELFDKAVRKLSKHTAKGELGELILFTVLDVYYQAPKMLSKISMKTNPRMPVFGADGVHGQFSDGLFRLYLGESKLHKDCNSAASKAVKSIGSAMEKYKDEFDLLDSFMDFPNIDPETEDQLLALLNPFNDKNGSVNIHSPCLIGFSNQKLIAAAGLKDEFESQYQLLAQSHIEHFFSQADQWSVCFDDTSLVLLPFSCVDDLVDQFISYMGIEN